MVTGRRPRGGSREVCRDLEAQRCFQLESCVRKADEELSGVLEDVNSYQQYLRMPSAVSQFGDLGGPLSHPWWCRHRKHDLWSWKGHLGSTAGSSVEIRPIDYSALFSCQTNFQRPRETKVGNKTIRKNLIWRGFNIRGFIS